jgi:phosphate transport system permease protein
MSGVLTNTKFRRHIHRRRVNVAAQILAMLAMVFGIFWLLWILFDIVQLGVTGLTWSVFTQMTPAPGDSGGGLANAIFGSLVMVSVATIVGTPIGILTGVYLTEFDSKSWVAECVRFVNDILLSAPSIVIGLFVYTIMVEPMKSFSGYAGSVGLALLAIPIIIRTSENMLQMVPSALREAAYALGAPKWKVIFSITLRSARAGIVTGVLLAIARISGETAPLLFTSLSNQFWSSNMSDPMTSLPVTIFKFAMSPYAQWQQLAWVGVFLITVTVLALNIIARAISRLH